MRLMPCLRCNNPTASHRKFCGYCTARLTSLNSQVALAQRAELTHEQRQWLERWFVLTKYFTFHRRMSRGRAKKLIEAMQLENIRRDNVALQLNPPFRGGELNPANVSNRGPHDLVTDAALQTSHTKGLSPLGSPS